ETYRFRWEIFGEDYVFLRGHRIGVVIAGSDRDWTIPDETHATVDVRLRRSKVILPVVGGKRRLSL
ncbi:MAG: X-prolyl-dipeptidyl aminopeptidase, partial [Actinomycetota bacterium]|nr:X-prolyl-dipeptidyl aminopeptidase [Actinomycetota bacterium]